jgi:putative aminopeptidase FrvX
MKDLIQKLVEIPGPPGSEEAVREFVRAEISSFSDEVNIDALGNLIAHRGPAAPSGGGLRVLVTAHLDEVGLMVRHVDDNGFVRFVPMGLLQPLHLAGSRVIFTGGARGVVAVERNDPPENTPGIEHLYIDMGAASREKCPVKVGDVAVIDQSFLDLGDRLAAKALDDRVGVAVLIEALRQVKSSPHEIFAVFSVQEEVGMRGAGPAAFGIDPQLSLALDVTPTGDTPRIHRTDIGLGKGPAIKVRDPGMIADPRVVRWMAASADKAGLPYQLEVLDSGSTDARVLQLVRGGVPAGCLSIPCRYVHTSSEMVDYRDVQNAAHLLAELLSYPIELGTE